MSKNRNKDKNLRFKREQARDFRPVPKSNAQIIAELDECDMCAPVKILRDRLEEADKNYNRFHKIAVDQAEIIDEQRKYIERCDATLEYFAVCLRWAEKHMDEKTAKKYGNKFCDATLIEYLRKRADDNHFNDRDIEANVDIQMIKELESE